MQNPFESGQIKNYVLLYTSVVVIMVLFFIASTLFNEVDEIEKKKFSTENNNSQAINLEEDQNKTFTPKFQLMESTY